MLDNTRTFWKENWRRHFNEYVSYVPLQAYYLYCLLGRSDTELLEIAGGSFHDTSCLNQWGIRCRGIDRCPDVVRMARRNDPALRGKIAVMDAGRMDFKDRSFDVSFHNGFFVNFRDDREIRRLLEEQARVTRRLIVCTVHNRLNADLIRKFKFLAENDDLYDIRFYAPEQLKRLLTPFCRKVMVLPVQVPEFDRLIGLTMARELVRKAYSRYYHTVDVHRCKRLMAVGYL